MLVVGWCLAAHTHTHDEEEAVEQKVRRSASRRQTTHAVIGAGNSWAPPAGSLTAANSRPGKVDEYHSSSPSSSTASDSRERLRAWLHALGDVCGVAAARFAGADEDGDALRRPPLRADHELHHGLAAVAKFGDELVRLEARGTGSEAVVRGSDWRAAATIRDVDARHARHEGID